MDSLDLDEVIRKNPHLDRESLDALRQYIQRVAPSQDTRYRLAPIGDRRATVGAPDRTRERPTLVRSYPRF